MLIANPIYDVVFKKLMEDTKIAKFFIETLTGETLSDIEVKPQEYTYNSELYGIMVYRLDFIATIKTDTNEYKKVLIEIQKAKNPVDLMRFRNYLAEQYKKEDEIITESGKEKIALPIVTIYLLGFKLNEINSPIIKVNRQYIDLIDNSVIYEKCEFVESLTHDSFIVQIPRIQTKLQTKLEELLSIFEQTNFIGNGEIVKDYKHHINNKTIKNMLNVLHFAGTDPAERLELEKEQEAIRVYELGYAPLKKEILIKNKIINEISRELVEKEIKIEEKDKTIEEKENELLEKDRLLQEALKMFEELKLQLKDK